MKRFNLKINETIWIANMQSKVIYGTVMYWNREFLQLNDGNNIKLFHISNIKYISRSETFQEV